MKHMFGLEEILMLACIFLTTANLSRIYFCCTIPQFSLEDQQILAEKALSKVWEFFDECSFDHSHWASTTCVCVGMKTGFWIDNKLHLKEEINTDFSHVLLLTIFTYFVFREWSWWSFHCVSVEKKIWMSFFDFIAIKEGWKDDL